MNAIHEGKNINRQGAGVPVCTDFTLEPLVFMFGIPICMAYALKGQTYVDSLVEIGDGHGVGGQCDLGLGIARAQRH
jgi:hypothetical protein